MCYNEQIGRYGTSVQACLNMCEEVLNTMKPEQRENFVRYVETFIKRRWGRGISPLIINVASLIINVNHYLIMSFQILKCKILLYIGYILVFYLVLLKLLSIKIYDMAHDHIDYNYYSYCSYGNYIVS